MADMIAKLVWQGGVRFTGTNADGIETAIDGDHRNAASPVEILLEALGACSAIDVVLILEKMRMPAARLEVSLDADRHSPEPRYLTRVRMRFDVWGDGIQSEKVARAVWLSLVRYCSVYNSLRSDLIVQPQFRLHASGAEASGEYDTVALGAEPTNA